MKLKDYMAKITDVIKKQRVEGEVLENASQSDNRNRPGKVKDEYERAITYVKEALAANRELLGIYNGTPIQPEELREKDIRKQDLERHILKLRHDLREHAPKMRDDEDPDKNRETCERIIFRIVVELNNALGVKNFGGVFSETEAVAYRTEFAPVRYMQAANYTHHAEVGLPQPSQHPTVLLPRPPAVPVPQPERPAIHPPAPKRAKKIKIPPQKQPTFSSPLRPPLPPIRLEFNKPVSEPPVASAYQLEEATKRAIEARNQARLQGMSPEDRKLIMEIEAKLRAEGKIQ